MTITIVARGIPKGQPRPRACVRGGHAAVYDPGTAEGWKGAVALAAGPLIPEQPLSGPLNVTIAFHFPRPKGHFRKGGLLAKSAPRYHTQKPDADNAAKAVLDVLTDIGMWRDDSQIYVLTIGKAWAETSESGAVITIEETQDAHD
jgi:crossover junction endodeoxyribonuclease RusA